MLKIRKMESQEFWPLYEKNEGKVFKGQIFNAHEHLTAHEKKGLPNRKKFVKERIKLFYGLFDGERFVGWCAGFQTNPNDFYMMSSGVLPKYCRKGHYSKMAKLMLAEAKRLGFQSVSSNHIISNNAVIIAKLKLGFTISGVEVSEFTGVLLKMVYHLNPLKAEILKYRTGESFPSARVKKAIKLKEKTPGSPRPPRVCYFYILANFSGKSPQAIQEMRSHRSRIPSPGEP